MCVGMDVLRKDSKVISWMIMMVILKCGWLCCTVFVLCSFRSFLFKASFDGTNCGEFQADVCCIRHWIKTE